MSTVFQLLSYFPCSNRLVNESFNQCGGQVVREGPVRRRKYGCLHSVNLYLLRVNTSYHKILPAKLYCAVVLGIFTELCSNHHNLSIIMFNPHSSIDLSNSSRRSLSDRLRTGAENLLLIVPPSPRWCHLIQKHSWYLE